MNTVKRKKIVLIEGDIMNAIIGFRKDLVDSLEKEGYDVHILGSYEDGRSPIYDNRLTDIGSTNLANTPMYILSLWKAINRIRPDICLTFNMRPTIYANLISAIFKIPTLSNITGVGSLFENKNLVYKLACVLYKFALKKPVKIFFQNTTDAALFFEKRYVTKVQIQNIPGSGVRTDFFVPIMQNKRHDSLVFLMVARLLKAKGVYEYIEAAKLIKQKYPYTEFQLLGRLWVGKGNPDVITESQIEKWKSEKTISYFGLTNEIKHFYGEADCIVLPSYREGTANVLLEAASMEKPLIATNVPGCKEIVEDGINGYLCEPKSAESLSIAIEKMIVLSKEERINMGQNGRFKVICEYDKPIVINKYLEIISSIINKN